MTVKIPIIIFYISLFVSSKENLCELLPRLKGSGLQFSPTSNLNAKHALRGVGVGVLSAVPPMTTRHWLQNS